MSTNIDRPTNLIVLDEREVKALIETKTTPNPLLTAPDSEADQDCVDCD